MSNTILNKVKSLGSLNVNKFNTLNNDVNGIDKDALALSITKFDKQIKQAKIIDDAKQWIKSDSGKLKLAQIGYSEMTVKKLVTLVYGYASPKFPNRMIQVYKAIAKDGQLKKDYIKYVKSNVNVYLSVKEKNRKKDDQVRTSIQGFLKWLKDDKPSEKTDEQTKEFKKYIFTVQDAQGKKQTSSIDSQNNAKTPLDLEELKSHIDAMTEIFEQASLKSKIGAGLNLTTADLS